MINHTVVKVIFAACLVLLISECLWELSISHLSLHMASGLGFVGVEQSHGLGAVNTCCGDQTV